uniref:Non-specific lipid-transfer protein 8 n=1 Tax=Elaeis guineensis var. tenera TaxID=51953 RepID=A0A6I9QUR4_ELAGV|nr:non-specific lipid-transfer protein 8 [Elaeis guineensis]
MASSSSLSLLFLLFLISIPMTLGNIACVAVLGPLAPCLSSFTKPIGEKPSELCCDGAQVVEEGTGSLLDKEEVCKCLKEMMEEHPMVTPEKAHNIASQCGVVLPFPSSHDKCSTMEK